jgi:hypothetical protein
LPFSSSNFLISPSINIESSLLRVVYPWASSLSTSVTTLFLLNLRLTLLLFCLELRLN